jgi:hypothetical protein
VSLLHFDGLMRLNAVVVAGPVPGHPNRHALCSNPGGAGRARQ